MHYTLLQEKLPFSIWERMSDQLFTFVILVVATYYLWNRMKELETKMSAYWEQDRAKMLDVIEKNTKAFEKLESKLK